MSSSRSRLGGWITFPFIIGLSLSYTTMLCWYIYALFLSNATMFLPCTQLYLCLLPGPGLVTGLSLGAVGRLINLIVYLIEEFNVKSIDAAQISNLVNGCSLLPVIGAIISDSFFLGSSVILISSVVSLLVLVLICYYMHTVFSAHSLSVLLSSLAFIIYINMIGLLTWLWCNLAHNYGVGLQMACRK